MRLDKNPPFVLTETSESQSNTTPTISFANAFPTAGNLPANPTFTAFDPDLKNGYSQQMNFTIEQGAMGRHGYPRELPWESLPANVARVRHQPAKIVSSRSGSTPASDSAVVNDYVLRFRRIVEFELASSGAIKRYSHGLLFQAEYQFVRSIGDELYAGPQDIRNFRADRADLSGLARHVFRLNYLYDLPFGKGKAFPELRGSCELPLGWLADRGNYERAIRDAVLGDV